MTIRSVIAKHMPRLRGLSVFVVVLGFVLLDSNAAQSLAPTSSSSTIIHRFDLDREIQGVPAVSIHQSRDGQAYWAGFVLRERHSEAAGRVCSYVAAVLVETPDEFFRNTLSCGPLWPEQGTRPLIASRRSLSENNGHLVGASYGVMLVPSDLTRVRLRFKGGPTVWRRVQRVGTKELAAAKLPSLGYVAFALGHDRCLAAVEVYGSSRLKPLAAATRPCDR